MAKTDGKEFFLICSSRSFLVLGFTVKSLIHFELILCVMPPPRVCCSVLHNCQVRETAQVSVDGGLGKEM